MKGPLLVMMLVLPLLCISPPDIVTEATGLIDADRTRSLDILEWDNTEVYRETDLVYRTAYGDLIPSREGMEMVTCSMNGKVVVTYGSGNSWESEMVHRSFHGQTSEAAEVTSIDAGDLLPEYPGDEIVAVDKYYTITLIRHDNGEWISEKIADKSVIDDWLYDVDIGELKENGDQLEIVVVSDSRKAWLFSRTESGWEGEVILVDKGVMDACWIADIMPEHPGNEIVFGGGRGVVVASYFENGTWKSKDIQLIGEFVNDILVADIDPTIPGEEIYVSTATGDLFSIYRENDIWVNETAHSEGRTIYGIDTGMIDGIPVISIGTYGHRVGLVWNDNGWQFDPIYGEIYYVMGTGVFDIDPAHPGQEVISLGYFGKVVMIYISSPGSETILPYEELTVGPGDLITTPIIVEGKGGFTGSVSLEASSANIQIGMSEISIPVDNVTSIQFTAPDDEGTYHLSIKAIDPFRVYYRNMTIIVSETTKPFSFKDPTYTAEVGIDRQATIRSVLLSDSGILNDMSIVYLDPIRGIEIIPEPSEITWGTNTPYDLDLTISADSSASPGRSFHFIVAEGTDNYRSAIVIDLIVKERSLADFLLAVSEPTVKAARGSNTSVTVGVISLYGFSNQVNLSIEKVPEGMELELLQVSVIPSAEIVLNISVIDAEGSSYIRIKGIWEQSVRDTYVKIEVDPPEKDLVVEPPDGPVVFDLSENGMGEGSFRLMLTPAGGTIDGVDIRLIGLNDNISVVLLPNRIDRLTYPLEVEIRLSGPAEDLGKVIVVNITSAGSGIYNELTLNVMVNGTTDDGGESGNVDSFFIVVMVLVLITLSIIAGFIFIRKNTLKENEDVISAHGDRSIHHERDPPFERSHGRSSRPGRGFR